MTDRETYFIHRLYLRTSPEFSSSVKALMPASMVVELKIRLDPPALNLTHDSYGGLEWALT